MSKRLEQDAMFRTLGAIWYSTLDALEPSAAARASDNMRDMAILYGNNPLCARWCSTLADGLQEVAPIKPRLIINNNKGS